MWTYKFVTTWEIPSMNVRQAPRKRDLRGKWSNASDKKLIQLRIYIFENHMPWFPINYLKSYPLNGAKIEL